MILTTVLKQLFAGRAGVSIDTLIADARAALAVNDLDAAETAATAILAVQPRHAEASYYAGLIAYKRGDHAGALTAFRRAEVHGPANAEHACLTALCYHALQDNASAQRYCEIALEHDPNYVNAHVLMAGIALPGPEYIDVIAAIHRSLKPATYLEVGVFQGRSLALADAATSAIGVDPQPEVRVPLGKNARVFAMTSDAFFRQHDVRAEYGGRPLDLAFIDGMHHFDFALRDFAQVERYCTQDSIVLVNDCFPLDRATATREYTTTFWSGDVWRLILALKKYRPDLEIHTIAARPTGLALIRNLDPQSRVLTENMDAIVAELMGTDYSVLDANKREMLNWFPNDWPKIEALLKPVAGRA
jgi:tetratricopeptide (TPR) repeat protein